MDLYIDFSSDEAIYLQLCNQIILGIATSRIHEGDSLPSVRQLADTIGINMHTVNKAYAILKQEGYLKLDRRKGAVINVSADKLLILSRMKSAFAAVVARGVANGVSRDETHALIDELYDELES